MAASLLRLEPLCIVTNVVYLKKKKERKELVRTCWYVDFGMYCKLSIENGSYRLVDQKPFRNRERDLDPVSARLHSEVYNWLQREGNRRWCSGTKNQLLRNRNHSCRTLKCGTAATASPPTSRLLIPFKVSQGLYACPVWHSFEHTYKHVHGRAQLRKRFCLTYLGSQSRLVNGKEACQCDIERGHLRRFVFQLPIQCEFECNPTETFGA